MTKHGKSVQSNQKFDHRSHRAKRLPHTKHAVATQIVIGVEPVLVVQGGRTLTNDNEKKKTVFLRLAWTGGSSLMDKNQQRGHSVSVGESQAQHDDLKHDFAMQGRGGPGSSQRNCRVVEEPWAPGVDCQISQ